MWRGRCDEECVLPRRPAVNAAAAPTVTGLRADIIPQRQFALRRWFSANPLWYYHAPAVKHTIHPNPRFFEQMDPAIRGLCKRLLDAGLRTTPSCQGHFYGRERFEQVWDELLREAAEIRADGLIVRDSESGRPFRFEQPSYALPWPDFEVFHDAAADHQSHGYMGIIVPPRRNDVAARLEHDRFRSGVARIEPDRELTTIFGAPTFGVYVEARSPEQRDAAWLELTQYVSRLM